MADDLGEKTEEPTPKKREDARESGNVARSQDLAGAFILIAGTLALWAASTWMLGGARDMLAAGLDGHALNNSVRTDDAMRGFAVISQAAVHYGLPVLLVAWLAAGLAQIGQIGWLFAPKALMPKLSKLNPGSGFKRIFGLSGLVKAILDSLKVAIVILVAMLTVVQHSRAIAVLPYLELMPALAQTGQLVIDLALRILLVLLFLGLIDYIYQRWKSTQDLRMSKQEVKDEMKQTEGDPDVKRRRMRMQQQIAMQRIGAAVPQADVIVTNPEHLAIAIQYDQQQMNAPRVVAKGADFLAMRIRQLAIRHGVPIVERKPLARAMYSEVEVGQEIPPQFFQAIAEILAYVYRLNGRAGAVGRRRA